MQGLLWGSSLIDRVNERIGGVANWLVLLSCLVSAGNAMIRYGYDTSSNAWLEAQWYMFAAVVMLGAAATLRRNEHVRVDVVYMGLSTRQQLWVDLLGGLLFLLPACLLFVWLSWHIFATSFLENEGSSNAGGLIRWPVKALLPLGFALVALQGLSEVVKRAAALQGFIQIDGKYERPLQ